MQGKNLHADLFIACCSLLDPDFAWWPCSITNSRCFDSFYVFYRNMIGCEALKGWEDKRWQLQWRGPSHGYIQTQSQSQNWFITISGLTHVFYQPSFKYSLQFYCASSSCLLPLLTSVLPVHPSQLAPLSCPDSLLSSSGASQTLPAPVGRIPDLLEWNGRAVLLSFTRTH